MERLRIAICEDDQSQRTHTASLVIESKIPVDIVEFSSGEEFLADFKPFYYDLILMDIFMEGLTGIDVITQVRAQDSVVPVAFITSSMDFTLESYRLEAFKYIEKPAAMRAVSEALQMAQMKRQIAQRITLRSGGEQVSYPVEQIMYLEQKGRNLILYLAGGEEITVNKKLDEVEGQLPGERFFRCHKSYLVNLGYVRSIDQNLSTFTMERGNIVHIRRELFWAAKKTFEGHLFASQEVTHE